MSKKKIRTVTIDPFIFDFRIMENELHGGYLQFEEYRNGTKIVVRVKVNSSWKLKKIKQAMNQMVKREIDIADNFVSAVNASDD